MSFELIVCGRDLLPGTSDGDHMPRRKIGRIVSRSAAVIYHNLDKSHRVWSHFSPLY